MPPRVKKTLYQNANDKKEDPDEKENKKSNLKKFSQKNIKNSGKVQFEIDYNELPEKSATSNVNRKPLGFWSKKVQDLEENETKKKKSALYEFSGTDESDSSYRTKKKIKRKLRLRKKKQPSTFTKKTCVKRKKNLPEVATGVMRQPLVEEKQIVLGQEKKSQTDKGEKFMFSPRPQFAVTSTPAANKNNFISASNFLFLSPIISEEVEGNVNKCSSPKQKITDSPVVPFNQETPKLDTKSKRVSFKRVLRNGKILDR